MHCPSPRPRKNFLINLLTLDERVFKTKTNVLQSFFHVTDVKRLQIFCYRLLSTASQVETTVINLLNISYTEVSSVLTEGEMSFTMYANTNMANTRIMYCYFEPGTTRHRGLVLSVSDFGTRGPGSISGWALITKCFLFFFFYPLVMQNYFIQIIWNYINDKNYTPKRLLLNYHRNLWGWGINFGPPERL